MSAPVLPTHTPSLFERAVREAVALLRQGEVVVLPTETVYGLAANALDPVSVQRIYSVKGRPAHNPIIVHVASKPMLAECVTHWPEAAEQLARAFWPGPMTLVLPKSGRIPDIVTAGGTTVAVRWPQHPFMQAVILGCGFPLAAPSANLSNCLSPTTAGHVSRQLGERVPLIVDGGDCNVGIESTVVDLTSTPPRVLRPGMISSESILATVGAGDSGVSGSSATSGRGALKSPGLLAKHYSPRARLLLLEWKDEPDLLRQLSERGIQPGADIQVLSHSRIPMGGRFPHVNVIPHDAEAFARGLYAELHRCDDAGARWIVVEMPPDQPMWHGITDRLRRAATP